MDYVSIRVSTLRGNQKIDFNAYLQIGNKMILFLKKGDSFAGERLERLKAKKLRKMFIPVSEEPFYRKYLERNIEVAYEDKTVDITERAEIAHGVQQNQIDEVFENPESEITYNAAKDSAGLFSNFLLNDAKALSAVLNIQNEDKSITHHGVTVATLSLALANKLGFQDTKKTQLLTLGALLHDFGHQEVPFNICKPLATFTKEEMNAWKEHPKLGAQKLASRTHFDTLVLNIIAQHEETINGTGPYRLKEKDMDPLSVIVSSANALDRLISFENIPRLDAAKTLTIDHMGRHPLNHIQLLADIIKNS